MATIKIKRLPKNIKDQLCGLRVRLINGKLTLRAAPKKRDGPLSDCQRNVQSKFKLASAYAKTATNKLETRTLYESGINKTLRSAYTVAFKDFQNPPNIENIDVAGYHGSVGDDIRVRAHDDFQVKSVHVVIVSSDGTPIEKGEAVLYNGVNLWKYHCTVNNNSLVGSKITVAVYDVAGNIAEQAVVLSSKYVTGE